MEEFSNKIFKHIAQPSDFSELLSLILEPIDSSGDLVRLWRGQSDINWSIDSSAYRRLKENKIHPNEENVRAYEKVILDRAKFKGYNLHEGRSLSDLELLALLRHNGAATRLVDFTKNALTGLWFTISSFQDRTGLLIGTQASFIHGDRLYYQDLSYSDILQLAGKVMHSITWEPTSVSPRVAAQHSQFIFSLIAESDYGSLGLPNDSDANLFIAITPDLKRESGYILAEVFDIKEESLFPDLSGFGSLHGADKYLGDIF